MVHSANTTERHYGARLFLFWSYHLFGQYCRAPAWIAPAHRKDQPADGFKLVAQRDQRCCPKIGHIVLMERGHSCPPRFGEFLRKRTRQECPNSVDVGS